MLFLGIEAFPLVHRGRPPGSRYLNTLYARLPRSYLELQVAAVRVF